MVKSGIVAGLKPEEIRDMTPQDAFLVFSGWQGAHSPKAVGSDAPSLSDLKNMMEQAHDGNHRRIA
mgnify:CR=1 FL=1|jgi:hypothetical protein|tara:strand:- start:2457 stop:2654 length:198 start_codon:yes stop_codon:yes gene_type:complete